MKPIDYVLFAPAIIFCIASVVGWLLGKPGFEKFAMAGIGLYLVTLAETR